MQVKSVGDTVERERRWLVIASDGRHATLGRASDPSDAELDNASESLQKLHLSGWLVVSEGHYYSQGELKLLMVRALTERAGTTWEEARNAFLANREKATRE